MDFSKDELKEAKRQIDSTLHKLRETIKTFETKENAERYKSQITLAKVFPAYMRKVQQDLQGQTTKGYTLCMQAYHLFQHGEIRNESKNITENNGTFRFGVTQKNPLFRG